MGRASTGIRNKKGIKARNWPPPITCRSPRTFNGRRLRTPIFLQEPKNPRTPIFQEPLSSCRSPYHLQVATPFNGRRGPRREDPGSKRVSKGTDSHLDSAKQPRGFLVQHAKRVRRRTLIRARSEGQGAASQIFFRNYAPVSQMGKRAFAISQTHNVRRPIDEGSKKLPYRSPAANHFAGGGSFRPPTLHFTNLRVNLDSYQETWHGPRSWDGQRPKT